MYYCDVVKVLIGQCTIVLKDTQHVHFYSKWKMMRKYNVCRFHMYALPILFICIDASAIQRGNSVLPLTTAA